MTQFCDVESNTLEFTIHNSENGNTFSAESVRALFNNIALYVASRIVRAWQKNEGPPKTMTIRIKVTIE